jgi:hypothetical protein
VEEGAAAVATQVSPEDSPADLEWNTPTAAEAAAAGAESSKEDATQEQQEEDAANEQPSTVAARRLSQGGGPPPADVNVTTVMSLRYQVAPMVSQVTVTVPANATLARPSPEQLQALREARLIELARVAGGARGEQGAEVGEGGSVPAGETGGMGLEHACAEILLSCMANGADAAVLPLHRQRHCTSFPAPSAGPHSHTLALPLPPAACLAAGFDALVLLHAVCCLLAC